MDPRQFCTTLESADADRLQIMRQYDPQGKNAERFYGFKNLISLPYIKNMSE